MWGIPFYGAAWCGAVSLGVSAVQDAGFSSSPIASPDVPEPYYAYLFLHYQQHDVHPFLTGTSGKPPLLAPWHIAYPILAGLLVGLAALYGAVSQFTSVADLIHVMDKFSRESGLSHAFLRMLPFVLHCPKV